MYAPNQRARLHTYKRIGACKSKKNKPEHTYMSIYVYICLYMYIYTYIDQNEQIRTYIYIYICIHIQTYVYIYIHTFTHINIKGEKSREGKKESNKYRRDDQFEYQKIYETIQITEKGLRPLPLNHSSNLRKTSLGIPASI